MVLSPVVMAMWPKIGLCTLEWTAAAQSPGLDDGAFDVPSRDPLNRRLARIRRFHPPGPIQTRSGPGCHHKVIPVRGPVPYSGLPNSFCWIPKALSSETSNLLCAVSEVMVT